MSDKEETPKEELTLPPDLRFLKTLVTVLAGVMILGLIAIITLFVIRFSSPREAAVRLPETITLPEGMTARAVTYGTGWYAVVTTGDEILIYDAKTGRLTQRVTIETAKPN